MNVINLTEKLNALPGYWQPRVIGAVNNFHVKVVKIHGRFAFHHHDTEDELFLVLKGKLLMHFRDREVWVNEGECLIVPHGMEHCPEAPEEVHMMMLEPSTTLNTGTVQNERTVEEQWI